MNLDALNHASHAASTLLCLIGMGALIAIAGAVTGWLGRRGRRRM
jgi:hypothetical protein